MAVENHNLKSTLAVKYVAGYNKEGKEIHKTQRFQKVMDDAKSEDLFAVANAIGTCLENPSVEVIREDSNLIIEG